MTPTLLFLLVSLVFLGPIVLAHTLKWVALKMGAARSSIDQFCHRVRLAVVGVSAILTLLGLLWEIVILLQRFSAVENSARPDWFSRWGVMDWAIFPIILVVIYLGLKCVKITISLAIAVLPELISDFRKALLRIPVPNFAPASAPFQLKFSNIWLYLGYSAAALFIWLSLDFLLKLLWHFDGHGMPVFTYEVVIGMLFVIAIWSITSRVLAFQPTLFSLVGPFTGGLLVGSWMRQLAQTGYGEIGLVGFKMIYVAFILDLIALLFTSLMTRPAPEQDGRDSTGPRRCVGRWKKACSK